MAVHWGGRGPGHVSRGGGLFASLRLDFLNNVSAIDPRITFTRASSATRVNSSGLIETVSSNVARIDYDPVTLAAKGLLIEEQRTNLLLRSQEFDNASWTKSRTSISANAATAPDGSVTAEKLVEDSTVSSTHRVYQPAAKAASSLTRTASIFVKSAERTKVAVRFSDQVEGVAARVDADLVAGTIGSATVGGGGTITAASASITQFSGGWYRVTITATFDATITGTVLFASLLDGSGAISYTGDGTSGLYVWGAQIEAGAFATSYIPTTSATVTRAADVASITGTNFSDWYNQTEGTFVAEASTFKPTSVVNTANIMLAWDGTANERIILRFLTANADGVVVDNNVVQVQLFQAYSVNATEKLAFAYKINDFAFARNGSLVGTDAGGMLPTVDRLILGAPELNGHIRRLTYYPARLSNALLQSLTA